MKPLRGRPLALLLLVLHLDACSSWQPLPVSPREYIGTEPTSIRITTLDGERAVLPEPAIANDSIHGILCEVSVVAAGDQVCTETSETQRYALADVTEWEVRGGRTWVTVLLVGVTAVGVLALITMLYQDIEIYGFPGGSS